MFKFNSILAVRENQNTMTKAKATREMILKLQRLNSQKHTLLLIIPSKLISAK